jgi:hypothetical protein
MSFKTSVLIVAVVVLLILMSIISILLRSAKNEDIYVDGCPDYWTTASETKPGVCLQSQYGCCPDRTTAKTDTDGTNCPSKCYNKYQLGTVSSTCPSIPTEMEFSGDQYTGTTGLCNKRKWSKQCGLTWDGITDVSMSC